MSEQPEETARANDEARKAARLQAQIAELWREVQNVMLAGDLPPEAVQQTFLNWLEQANSQPRHYPQLTSEERAGGIKGLAGREVPPGVTKLMTALQMAGITNIGQLLLCSGEELLDVRNFGIGSLKLLKELLDKSDLALWPDDKPSLFGYGPHEVDWVDLGDRYVVRVRVPRQCLPDIPAVWLSRTEQEAVVLKGLAREAQIATVAELLQHASRPRFRGLPPRLVSENTMQVIRNVLTSVGLQVHHP